MLNYLLEKLISPIRKLKSLIFSMFESTEIKQIKEDKDLAKGLKSIKDEEDLINSDFDLAIKESEKSYKEEQAKQVLEDEKFARDIDNTKRLALEREKQRSNYPDLFSSGRGTGINWAASTIPSAPLSSEIVRRPYMDI